MLPIQPYGEQKRHVMSSSLICQPPGSKKVQTLLAALLILTMEFIPQILKDLKVFLRTWLERLMLIIIIIMMMPKTRSFMPNHHLEMMKLMS
uniref:Uncharacterized protein n=1 Tax=Zea mays TaxID=4577 RepID=B4FC30_MAIZE|nr:unknown [Zea mays]